MAGNKSLQRFVRRNIYALKRQYGARVDVYRVVSSETDHLTGEKTVVREVYRVRRAPVLPYNMKREIVQTISIISADKSFVYGAAYDAAKRDIIIDLRDLPKDFEIRSEDYVVFEGARWDVVNVAKFEYDTGVILTVKNLPGMPAYEFKDVIVTQDLGLLDSAGGMTAPSIPAFASSNLNLTNDYTVIKIAGEGAPINASSLNLSQSATFTVN